MEIIADRFVMRGPDQAIDLATGSPIVLRRSIAAGPSEHLRWTLRCEWFAQLRHRWIAPLLDYGRLGETERFEAWSGAPEEQPPTHDTQQVHLHANAFLRSCARSPVAPAAAHVCRRGQHLALVPSSESGFAADGPVLAGALPLHAHGIAVVSRRTMRALAESIAHGATVRTELLELSGPPGSGLATAIAAIARIARLQGFVAVSSACARDPALAPALQGRSLLVITPEDDGADARWRNLLRWTLQAGRPHIVLATSRRGGQGNSLVLEPISAAALAGAVVPAPSTENLRREVDRAARRAAGLPGRFVETIWHTSDAPYRLSPRVRSVAAERQVAYVVGVDGTRPPSSARPTASDPSEVDRRLQAGFTQLQRGRHAEAARTLRSASAALQRRSSWLAAATGLLALARLHLSRGRPAAARSALHEAEVAACRAEADLLLVDIAVAGGTAWTDLARLDDAERTLAAAMSAASGWADQGRMADAALALSRCLFWRGRFAEAASTLDAVTTDGLAAAVRARLGAARSRALVGQGDLPQAIQAAARALDEAAGNPDAVATCGRAAAFVHLAVNDAAAVQREGRAVLAACRARHDPLGALKARLLMAESGRRAGHPREALALCARIRRLGPGAPPRIRAQAALLEELARGAPAAATVERHVGRTSLAALKLCAGPVGPLHASGELMDDVLDILKSCQTADDERTVLEQVCLRLRGRLRAVATGILLAERGTLVVAGADGAVDDGVARRVLDAAQGISPHRWEDMIVAGSPVVYSGETLAVLVSRWSLASPPDSARSMAILAMAATAVAPLVAAVQARRRAIPAEKDDLLGASAAMDTVRRAVERAARAPFPVLIEGESGCGKELVARALHRRSTRRDRPFCAVNCAALPDDLVEAELFGHARGAFTGAAVERPGVFEEAHTGTLFLDEVGELSPRAQAKLLRTLQEGEVRRVGENVPRRVDVRIVAATNRTLRDEVAAGRFRVDLLYRLDVVRIWIPPLRERREDIPILAEHFWREASARMGSRATLTSAALGALTAHPWPGNVRELQNVLAALAVRCPRRGAIGPELLPAAFSQTPHQASTALAEARRTFEEQFVRAALVRTGGHRARAARELGVSRQGLAKLMSRLGIARQSG